MPSPHRESSEWVRFIGHLLPYVAALGMAALAIAVRRWREKVGANWPVVEGQVQFVHVRIGEGRDHLKHAVITYSYFLEEYRSGEYVRTFLREQPAWDFANGLKNKRVPVHYNASRPSVSTLRREELERILPVKSENSFTDHP